MTSKEVASLFSLCLHVFSGFSGFFPQSENVHVRQCRSYELSVGMIVNSCCLSLCGPAANLQLTAFSQNHNPHVKLVKRTNYDILRKKSWEILNLSDKLLFMLCSRKSPCSNGPPQSHFASVLCAQNQFTPSEVVQWSNHRVMEWLRSVDLAEYAPNLRGSGVHGGLIVSIHFHMKKQLFCLVHDCPSTYVRLAMEWC